jgi:hypothetical protein
MFKTIFVTTIAVCSTKDSNVEFSTSFTFRYQEDEIHKLSKKYVKTLVLSTNSVYPQAFAQF